MRAFKWLGDLIYYNGGRGPEDGNNYWRRFTAARYVYVGLMLLMISLLAGLTALYVGATYPGYEYGRPLFRTYFQEPYILIVNLIPGVLLCTFFYFLTGRAWGGVLGCVLPVLGLAIAGFYKMDIRQETLVASDLGLVGEAMGVISNYTLKFTLRTAVTIAAFILSLAFAAIFLRGRLKNIWVRVGGTAVSLALIVLAMVFIYLDPGVETKMVNDSSGLGNWVEQQVYAYRGFVYSFLHSVGDVVDAPPEGYSEGRAREILSRYEEGTIAPERRVNVIAVMFEAYSDLSEYPEFGVYDEVYEPFHELEAQSISGHLVVNKFGGGTVDTERNFLTGFTPMEGYRSPTNSYVYFLRQNGYYAEGVHPGDGWFYNRANVQRNLGFQNYYFLEDLGGDRSDECFFRFLTERVEARDAGTPYFNFSVTYQNHGGYDGSSTGEEQYLERGDLSEENFNILNNYLIGIADTSRRMLDFVDSLRDDPEPFVVVFFGDHKPYLAGAYGGAGVNMDLSTPEGFYNYYSTPYIIWANDAAKAATGGSFTGEGGDFSPTFLMDRLFEECGWGRSGFMALTHELYAHVDIMNTETDSFRVAGELTKTPTGEALGLLEDYRIAQYYLRHNFNYSELYGG